MAPLISQEGYRIKKDFCSEYCWQWVYKKYEIVNIKSEKWKIWNVYIIWCFSITDSETRGQSCWSPAQKKEWRGWRRPTLPTKNIWVKTLSTRNTWVKTLFNKNIWVRTLSTKKYLGRIIIQQKYLDKNIIHQKIFGSNERFLANKRFYRQKYNELIIIIKRTMVLWNSGDKVKFSPLFNIPVEIRLRPGRSSFWKWWRWQCKLPSFRPAHNIRLNPFYDYNHCVCLYSLYDKWIRGASQKNG